jgi:hypothetical protein
MSSHQTIKFEYPKKQLSFSEREKIKNEKILDFINSLRIKNLFVKTHNIISNTASFFTVKFDF